jgi:hypothetical protein
MSIQPYAQLPIYKNTSLVDKILKAYFQYFKGRGRGRRHLALYWHLPMPSLQRSFATALLLYVRISYL